MSNDQFKMFQRIKKDKELDSKSLLQDLVEFHGKIPAMTENTYGSSKASDGRTSYKILADQFSNYRGKVIVDLACGNGPLIELLLKSSNQPRKIIGVDLSSSDLVETKQRCRADNVEFILSPADNLPIEENSIDIVLCHLAFFLFNPIESAVKEISRILKPGGGFATIISGLGKSNDRFLNTVKILQDAVAQMYPHLKDFGWGDIRANSKEGIASLFSDGFESPDFFDFPLVVSETSPEKLANRLIHYFYAGALLSEEKKYFVIKNWTNLFSDMAGMGSVELHFPLTAVRVAKSV